MRHSCAWQTLDLPQIRANLITAGFNISRMIFTCLSQLFGVRRCYTVSVHYALFVLSCQGVEADILRLVNYFFCRVCLRLTESKFQTQCLE